MEGVNSKVGSQVYFDFTAGNSEGQAEADRMLRLNRKSVSMPLLSFTCPITPVKLTAINPHLS